MKSIKSIFMISALLANVGSLCASISFLNTAIKDAPGLVSGDFGVLIVDNNNSGFGSLSVLAGNSLTSSATYAGFTVLGSNTATFNFGSTSLSITPTFDLGAGVDAGDKFAIIIFDTSLTNAVGGDTFRIWTDASWLVPADGTTATFAVPPGGDFAQVSGAASFSGTVSAVPEPATYAAIFGFTALGFCAVRRRRRA